MAKFSASLLWFSFRDDADCLLESVRAARHHAPDAPRVVAMDAGAPLPLDVQARLRDEGCQVETDFVDRQTNLNGIEHWLHQMDWMTAAGDVQDAQSWVVKIDSDTLLNAPLATWLGEAGPVHEAVCAWQPKWWFQGPCYALRATAARQIRDAVAARPERVAACAPKYREDETTGHALAGVYGPASILALPGGHSSTLFHGLQIAHYDYRMWPDFAIYSAFRTLHFGNRAELPPHMPDAVRRHTAAATMRRYLNEAGLPP